MEILDSNSDDPGVRRIGRFQALQAGQYWRAIEAIPEEGIDCGMVLLLQSLRLVDDQPHTVVLRPHPLKIGTQEELLIPQEDGSVRKKWINFDEHRFLVKNFLNLFQFEPDHKAIREGEILAVQGRVAQLQGELVEGQADPIKVAAIVHEGLAARAEAERERSAGAIESDGEAAPSGEAKLSDGGGLPATIPEMDERTVALATGTVMDAIASGVTIERIEALKVAASREHAVATIKASWIQGKTDEIAKTLKKLAPYYAEHAAAALAHTEDVQKYVRDLLQGIQSLDLYLGKGVEVLCIREGKGAPPEEPLTLCQAKLCMDQELCVWADVDETFDFEDQEVFFQALRDHDGFVDQIFPAQRCVLVMCTTARHIDYGGGPLANAMLNQRNSQVFLLVRNGGSVYQVISPVESHLGSARLFPNKDEQDRVFSGFDGSRMKFEDVAYTDALRNHERMAMHYKRFLLLACGLDHRLGLFGDFYPGPKSLQFVSLEFQGRYCRFIHNDDRSMAIAGGPKRPSFREWLAVMNSYLHSGSRVLCSWMDLMNPTTAPGACKYDYSSRRSGYDFRARPLTPVQAAIAYKDGDAIVVDCAVEHERTSRAYQCKVAVSKYKMTEWEGSQTAFLVLDAVDPAELRWYIQHRDSRKSHLEYIRFFKRAVRHVESDRAAEVDSRRRLLQALVDGGIGSVGERAGLVDRAVIAWRAANRGAALPCFAGEKAPAGWSALLDQMFVLAGPGEQERRIEEAERFVHALGYQPLRLVLSGGAKLVVYAAPTQVEVDDRLEPHAWVHRMTLERGKTRMVEKARRWSILPPIAASETTLKQWPDSEKWVGRPTAFGSFARKQALLAQPDMFSERISPFLSAMSPESFAKHSRHWGDLRDRMVAGAPFVNILRLAIPIGAMLADGKLVYVCVGHAHPHALLAKLAPTAGDVAVLRTRFVRPYESKERARRLFAPAMGDRGGWCLFAVDAVSYLRAESVFVANDMGVEIEHLSGSSVSPLLSDWFSAWLGEKRREHRVWMSPEALDQEGRLNLDRLLEISLPQGYSPVEVKEFRITLIAKKGAMPLANSQYLHWFDIRLSGLRPSREDRRFWPVPETASGEFDAHCASAKALVKGDFGLSSTARDEVSLQRARERIAEEHPGAKQASSDLDAPQPPAGFERWYIFDQEVGSDMD